MELSRQIIESELTRITSARQIKKSMVLSDFLKFVVNETLAGRSDELKEYTIGINVLKRETDFNPQIDSIVRIHAGRLRRALKEYYYEEGRADQLVISIPKGGYVPNFQFNATECKADSSNALAPAGEPDDHSDGATDNKLNMNTAAQRINSLITLAVLPFSYSGQVEGESFATSLGEFLCTEFTLFNYLQVVSYYSGSEAISKTRDLREISSFLETDYLLTGSVHSYEGRVRAWIQLNNSKGQQMWGHTFENIYIDEKLGECQEYIVRYLIAYLMGMNGLILRDKFNQITDPSDLANPLLPIYWYSKFDFNYNEEVTRKAKNFYNQLIAKKPGNALAHAYLSKVLIGESLLSLKNIQENIRLGHTHSLLSIRIDPDCQQGYVGLAAIHILKHQRERCVEILNQGYRVNPRNYDYQNSMGALLFSIGEYERGVPLLCENYRLNPHNILRWQKLKYAYYLFHEKRYDEVHSILENIDLEIPSVLWLRASSFAQTGQIQLAKKILNTIKYQFNCSEEPLLESMKKYFFCSVLREELSGGLNKIDLSANTDIPEISFRNITNHIT